MVPDTVRGTDLRKITTQDNISSPPHPFLKDQVTHPRILKDLYLPDKSPEIHFVPYGKMTFVQQNSSAVAALEPLVEEQKTEAARGYDPSNMDPRFKPGEDFYRYAVGGYLEKHPIPAEKASYGVASVLQEENQQKLKVILEEASGNRSPMPGSNVQKIGDFYASGMDLEAVEAAGIKPLAPEFQRIQEIKTLQDLQDEVAHLHTLGVRLCFDFASTQDAENPEMVIGQASQGGLGLPDRDYYLRDDEATRKIRDEYLEHMSRMFQLMGDPPETASSEAEKVMEIETRLARASLTNVELRDPQKTYHIYDRSQLAQLTPGFCWDYYFTSIGRPDIQKINMATPGFFEEIDKAFSTIPLDDWKTYLRWHLINRTAPFVSSPFVEEDFNFKGRILNGIEKMPPRWKKIVGYTDRYLGQALGKEFVKRHFPPEAKARALEMIENIKSVLRERISGADWMGEETKKEALAKVNTFVAKIGYPDRWKSYSTLDIDRSNPFVTNVLKANEFAVIDDLSRIGKPVDRTFWYLSPPTVNAYYNPQMNEIVFPAGILQPPFFDMEADDAANYGGIGAIIAHEITHGFDDEGSQFDSAGRLRNWWQPEDRARFLQRAQGVEKQFSELEFDGSRVNGKLVCGESLADLGGVELAYAAFKKAADGKSEPVSSDGFTREQRFFLSHALSWATNLRKEFAHFLINTDPHPLPEFRTNAILANVRPFHEAFDLKEGDPMVRPEKDRNKLWGS